MTCVPTFYEWRLTASPATPTSSELQLCNLVCRFTLDQPVGTVDVHRRLTAAGLLAQEPSERLDGPGVMIRYNEQGVLILLPERRLVLGTGDTAQAAYAEQLVRVLAVLNAGRERPIGCIDARDTNAVLRRGLPFNVDRSVVRRVNRQPDADRRPARQSQWCKLRIAVGATTDARGRDRVSHVTALIFDSSVVYVGCADQALICSFDAQVCAYLALHARGSERRADGDDVDGDVPMLVEELNRLALDNDDGGGGGGDDDEDDCAAQDTSE